MKSRATNLEIARVFFSVSEYLALLGANSFRIRAYSRAAQALEAHHAEVFELYQKGGTKALETLPGIGEDLALSIEELLRTGELEFLKSLEKKVPKGLREILRIEGMGPARTRFVWKKFGVTTVKALHKLLDSGKLVAIKGWGERSVANILRGIDLLGMMGTRVPLPIAYRLAHTIRIMLKKSDLCDQVEVAGSVRRMKDTVGDIDFVATSKHPEKLMQFFIELPQVHEVLAHGSTKSSVFLRAGIKADIRIVNAKEFGAALYYSTGSKEHNVAVRKWAKKHKTTISEYGVHLGTSEEKGKLLASETEEQIFRVLGMQYVPPELREDSGEIELAREYKLPKLIEQGDLCGDLHAHSSFSDGVDTMADMALAARHAGLSYIAITDHASTIGLVKGIKEHRMDDYLKKIDAVRRKVHGIHVIAGAEVDILDNGQLYLSDTALSRLEWVVASVHSGFRQPEKTMTARIIKAMQNPYVSMIGHPTTRLLGDRAPIAFDAPKIFKAAKKAGIALEVSASPSRLDLDDIHAKEAKEMGVELAISSDAHAVGGFDFRFGVGQARRAWLTKKDVLNALPWAEFKKRLLKRI